MRKLVFAAGFTAVFALGSFVAIPANGIDRNAGFATGTDSSAASARSAEARLLSINQALYPDDATVQGDWLCDGMTPCVELSPR